MTDKRLVDHEMIDLLVTLAIAFREHNGKAKIMKRVAERIFKRLRFDETKNICEQFIVYPEKTEFKLNVLTQTFYGRQILKILA